MRFSLRVDEFASVVAWSAPAAGQDVVRPGAPAGVLIEVDATARGVMVGAGPDSGRSAYFLAGPADERGVGPGRAVVPATLLAHVAKSLPKDGTVLVNLPVPGGLSVQAGRVLFQLATLPGAPDVVDVPGPNGTVHSATFAERAAKVAPFAGKDAGRPALMCVRMTALECGHEIGMVATNGYAVCQTRLPISWEALGFPDTLVLARVLAADARALPAESTGLTGVALAPDGGVFALRSAGGISYTRPLALAYPNIAPMFSLADSPALEVIASAAELTAAVRRVAGVATSEFGVPVTLTFNGPLLAVDAISEAAGASSTLELAEVLTGTAGVRSVRVQSRYLLDSVAACADGDQVRLILTEQRGALYLSDPEQVTECLIMPIRS